MPFSVSLARENGNFCKFYVKRTSFEPDCFVGNFYLYVHITTYLT